MRLEWDRERRDATGACSRTSTAWTRDLFVNAELVRRGIATPLRVEPNVAHAEELGRLADRARDAGRGLWAAARRVETLWSGTLYAPMRMRQSLADIEAAFVEELEEDRERAERMQRRAVKRTRKRRVEREQKLGSMRFGLVLTVIIATAVVVTIAMFQALYIVMG